MAGTNLTRLNVALTLTTAAFNRSAMAAQNSLDKFGKSISNIGQIASRGLQIGLATATAAAAGLAYGVKRSAESIDEMAKASDRLGVSMEFLGGLTVLSKDANVSTQTLEKSILKLNSAIADAANGSKEAQQSLAAFGLTAGQLSGLNTEQRFAAIADASQKMGTTIERNVALMDLFGKEGASLSNAFKDGAEGIKKAEQEAKDLGITVSRLDAFKVEEMSDAFDQAGMSIKGALQNLTVAIAPVATAFAKFFTQSAKDTNGFKTQIDDMLDGVVKFASITGNALQGLRIAWNYVTYGVSQLSVGIYSLTDEIIRSAQWWGEAFSRVWNVMVSGFNVVRDSLSLGWAYLKVPLAAFIQFAVGQMGDLVAKTGELMLRVNNEVGVALIEAGMQARASVGAMKGNAERDFAAAKVSLSNSAEASGRAWKTMFSDVKVSGNETINSLLANAKRWRDDESASIDKLRAQNWYGDDLKKFIDAARVKSDINAKIKADKAKETKAQEDAANAENARKKAMLAEDKRYMGELEQASAKTGNQLLQDSINRANLANTNILTQVADLFGAFDNLRGDDLIKAQQTWSMYGKEFNKFLGNLATLQQSHDKRLRAIGKVAAKAQIVSATAVAAIESIKSFSGLGPWGVAAGYAAAAAAVAAGAVQLANVDRGTIGMGGGGASTTVDSSGDFGGGASRTPTQTLVVQGDYLTPETLARLFSEAKEKGIQIEGVRRA